MRFNTPSTWSKTVKVDNAISTNILVVDLICLHKLFIYCVLRIYFVTFFKVFVL